MYVKRNIEARSCIHCLSGKPMSVCVCDCSLRCPACNAHGPYCHLWPDPLHSVFPHFLINDTILEKKNYWIRNVFWFSLQFLTERFFILNRITWDMVKMYIGLHVKYPLFLSDFNEILIFSKDFSKKSQISNFMKIHPVGAELVRKRTDRHNEANSGFSQFCERT